MKGDRFQLKDNFIELIKLNVDTKGAPTAAQTNCKPIKETPERLSPLRDEQHTYMYNHMEVPLGVSDVLIIGVQLGNYKYILDTSCG